MSKIVVKDGVLPKGWREVRLGEVSQFSKGNGITKNEVITEGVPCVRYGELYTKHNFRINDFYSFISDKNSGKHKLIKNNDLLFAGSGETREEIGKCASFHHNVKAYAGGDVIICSIDPKILRADFASYYLNTIGRRQLNKLGQGDSIVHIYSQFLEIVEIPIPPLPEQKAIASLLETWDTAIEKTEALITAKQKQFEWLIEVLISKRQYSTEWNKSTLGDLFDIYTYSSKSRLIDNTGKRIVVDMGSISRKGNLIANKRTNSNQDLLQTYDLVMPKDDIGGGNIIGKVAIIALSGKFVCGDHVYRLVQKRKNNAHFLKFLINCNAVNRQLRARANGTSQLGLSKQDVLKQQVWIPSLTEQEHIANTLKTAHSGLTSLEQLVKQYHVQKRGLMQKLLTGQWKTRL